MEYPRIKSAPGAVRLSPTKIILGARQWGIGAELTDDAEGSLWRLLELMDGSRTRQEIGSRLATEYPDVDLPAVLETVDALVESGFFEDAAAPVPAELSADELERYTRSRHFYAWIDRTPRPSPWEIQRR